MNNRLHYIWSLILICISCMPEENLPIQDMGKTPGYFVECFCKPGEIFALSAMNIVPVSEELKMDFSSNMDITIRANQKISLSYSLFTLPGSSFVYNYGSNERMKKDADTLYLDITTGNNEKITGQTPIPEDVSIDSYSLGDNKITIRFYSSRNSSQNYYIITASLSDNNSVFEQKAFFGDYSQHKGGRLIEKSIKTDNLQEADWINLNLKRITKANYDYQISLSGANSANQSSITTPVPLKGNLKGAIGIFTCYTEDNRIIRP